jgi:hypothetical protein
MENKQMKLRSWIKNLFKPRFYLRSQPVFVTGSCGQSIPIRLKSFESHMPLLSRPAAVCFCWALFLAIPVAVFGQTSYYAASGTEYPIIGSLPGDQIYPDVALNATNGGYVVWQDNITDPIGEGISAMQLNSTISGSGDIFAVNATSTNAANAHVVLLQNGGAAFVWQAGPNNAPHVYTRFLNASNLWLSTTDIWVSTFTSSFQNDPAIARLTNGNVVIVYSSFDQAGSNSLEDVYGQMFSPSGTAIGTNFLINTFTTYNQRNAAVAALNNGGFVVDWVSEQERSTAPDWGSNTVLYGATAIPLPSVDIYERLYTVSGGSVVPSSSEILVNQDINPCASPAVATAADGSYMVTWCARNLTNSVNSLDIYERSFTNATGGSVNLVNSYTFGDQYDPRISVIGGSYLIIFTSLGQDGNREGVFGQFINEGDSLVGGEFQVNTTTLGQQMEEAVTSDGQGQFLTVWTSFTFGPNSFDLYAQRYENVNEELAPMAAPFVWAPFVLSNGVYQPELVVSWPPVQGLTVSNYQVYVDGAATNMAVVTTNGWTMTSANGLTTNSTHSFALTYVTAAGFQSSISPSTSGTTWSGLNWGGIPYEWMAEWFGGYIGGVYYTKNWPLANSLDVPGGPTYLQVFITGGNPFIPSTWLQMTVTQTAQGMFLNWNTQPGMTYQVQATTDFKTWNNCGAPRFAAGTNDSIYCGGSPASYYRIQLLRQ